MRTHLSLPMRIVIDLASLALCLAMLGGCLLVASGCAIGMRDNLDGTRTPVAGIALGETPGEGTQAAIQGGASLVGGLIGGPQGAAIAGSLAAAAMGAIGWTSKKRREAEVTAAEKSGAERGWEEREKAAVTQQPITTETEEA